MKIASSPRGHAGGRYGFVAEMNAATGQSAEDEN
jgi:hypothetical protein